jgi:hypothetical protein
MLVAGICRDDRVVNHRFVVHRHELLAHSLGDRVKPCTGAPCDNDTITSHFDKLSKETTLEFVDLTKYE